MTKSIKLNVGDYAPEFSCADKDGKIVTLKDLIKNQLYYISMVKMVHQFAPKKHVNLGIDMKIRRCWC